MIMSIQNGVHVFDDQFNEGPDNAGENPTIRLPHWGYHIRRPI